MGKARTGRKNGPNDLEKQFLPYNKSILTRILYQQLKSNNVLVINHYSKSAIERHLNLQLSSSYAPGPARGLFNSVMKLGFGIGGGGKQASQGPLNRITK